MKKFHWNANQNNFPGDSNFCAFGDTFETLPAFVAFFEFFLFKVFISFYFKLISIYSTSEAVSTTW